MHPAFDALFPDTPIDPPSSLLGGEELLARIYNAIRSAAAPTGSNAWNTLLMVTFDEHGGTYDHIPPPLVPPPVPGQRQGQLGFAFDRSGVRVPAMAISAWLPERTVVTGHYRHTSVISTLRRRWQLGDPLTARDTVAADLEPLLSLGVPRDPQDWPEVTPRPVPAYHGAIPAPDAAVRGLGKAVLHAGIALARYRGHAAPQLDYDEDVCRADAVALLADLGPHMFPRLQQSETPP
jgi:phospholipase C